MSRTTRAVAVMSLAFVAALITSCGPQPGGPDQDPDPATVVACSAEYHRIEGAIARHLDGEGAVPATLADLTPEYLDPADGPLVFDWTYAPTPDGYWTLTGGVPGCMSYVDPITACRTERETIEVALEAYAVETGSFPASLQALLDSRYLKEQRYPWAYTTNGESFTLTGDC